MAELSVQPKKKTSVLPWILLLLGIAALIWFLLTRNTDDKALVDNSQTATVATTVPEGVADNDSAGWNGIDFNAPSVNYQEITDKNINVRGNSEYGIYGLGENILFDEGKATLRSDAEANLKQVAASVERRYKGGKLRIYGFTDAQGSAGANKELAQQRADAVKTWLQSNGLDAGRISVNAIGESQPVATNATEEGRQQNRRVEIVARGGSATQ